MVDNNIVKLAVDLYHGSPEKYSIDESVETLRKALIEANGGSSVLNYKNIRDGKCTGLFAIIEEIIEKTAFEGFQENPFVQKYVDFRNLKLGDKNEFIVENSNLFSVDKIAEGTQAIRRQRIEDATPVELKTALRGVRIYEELNRILAGRVDFNKLIDKVSDSFRNQMLSDVYAIWNNLTAADLGDANFFPVAGTYNEDTLLSVMENVEAASGGKMPMIIGTRAACRMLKESVQSEMAKEEMHKWGFYGTFYGAPVMVMPQQFKDRSSNNPADRFLFNDKVLTIVATDDKPFKFVEEGDALIIPGNPLDNADLTQEYFCAHRYGVGFASAGNSGVGRYQTT